MSSDDHRDLLARLYADPPHDELEGPPMEPEARDQWTAWSNVRARVHEADEAEPLRPAFRARLRAEVMAEAERPRGWARWRRWLLGPGAWWASAAAVAAAVVLVVDVPDPASEATWVAPDPASPPSPPSPRSAAPPAFAAAPPEEAPSAEADPDGARDEAASEEMEAALRPPPAPRARRERSAPPPTPAPKAMAGAAERSAERRKRPDVQPDVEVDGEVALPAGGVPSDAAGAADVLAEDGRVDEGLAVAREADQPARGAWLRSSSSREDRFRLETEDAAPLGRSAGKEERAVARGAAKTAQDRSGRQPAISRRSEDRPASLPAAVAAALARADRAVEAQRWRAAERAYAEAEAACRSDAERRWVWIGRAETAALRDDPMRARALAERVARSGTDLPPALRERVQAVLQRTAPGRPSNAEQKANPSSSE